MDTLYLKQLKKNKSINKFSFVSWYPVYVKILFLSHTPPPPKKKKKNYSFFFITFKGQSKYINFPFFKSKYFIISEFSYFWPLSPTN